MKFEVCSDISSYKSYGESVSGQLYIETEYGAFPQIGWTDKVSDVLITWAESFLMLFEANLKAEEEFLFLFGPYSFTVAAQGAGQTLINLYHGTQKLNPKAMEVSFYKVLFAVYQSIDDAASDERFKHIQNQKRLKSLSVRLKKKAENYGYHMK